MKFTLFAVAALGSSIAASVTDYQTRNCLMVVDYSFLSMEKGLYQRCRGGLTGGLVGNDKLMGRDFIPVAFN